MRSLANLGTSRISALEEYVVSFSGLPAKDDLIEDGDLAIAHEYLAVADSVADVAAPGWHTRDV